MREDFKGRHLVNLLEYRGEEIEYLLELAQDLKEKQRGGISHRHLDGKTLAMIFQKPSTRTRVSFEVGMEHLGGRGLFLSSQELQIGRGEPVKDTARVLSRYVEGIMIRTFQQEEVEELASNATIPVINGLTDRFHPCQALADFLTVKEFKGSFTPDLQVTYLGDGNNVAHSLMLAGAKLGVQVNLAHPPGYAPHTGIVTEAKAEAARTGGEVKVTEDPREAVRGAQVVYTDVWASMGQEGEQQERMQTFQPYQLNRELLRQAVSQALVMHCLPAHRGEEITEEVMESEQSVVFQQAENRLHAQKALLALLMQD